MRPVLFIAEGDRIGRLVGTIVMEAGPEPVVLIAREATLLSVLCARLALAGDTPVTASASTDPRLDAALRDRALLVIQSTTLSCNPEEAVAMLRAQGWNGKLLLLVGGNQRLAGMRNGLSGKSDKGRRGARLRLFHLSVFGDQAGRKGDAKRLR